MEKEPARRGRGRGPGRRLRGAYQWGQLTVVGRKGMGTDLRLQLKRPPFPSRLEPLNAELVRSGSLVVSSLKAGSGLHGDAYAPLDHRALVLVAVFQEEDG